ncbi:MAG: linear amide C-N hydrolase, partial [Oscillospiraceae bacterium]|nr:linear amide C-N hydrolase [Oscillospiraceae bacterium]
MCTAITYQTKDHYFGRNLDLEYCFDERVTITPRNYPFHFRTMGEMPTHYAMIGMAYVAEGYPLYYEATNEHGLSMAGLNFPGNACWFEPKKGKDNVSPFEFIPWILGQCKNLAEARTLIE